MIYKLYLGIKNNTDLIPVFGIPMLIALIVTYIGLNIVNNITLAFV